MKMLFRLVAACCLVGSTIAQSYTPCSDVNTGAVTPKIPLPLLPTAQFKAVVRAEIVNKKMTVEATEYVDETRDMAALKVVQQGTTATILMSYRTDEVFYMEPTSQLNLDLAGPMGCEVKNMSTDDNTQLFGMKVDHSGNYPHLFSTSKILEFMNGTEVYKGRTNVSGIPVNKWSSCVSWPELHANFTLDYYFTVPEWTTPSGLHQIPVRADVHGETRFENGTHWTFHHIYEYVNFENYISDPETIFQTPPGVLCQTRKSERKLPTVGSHFYYREEISDPPGKNFALIQETDIWYDYSMSMIRFDKRSPPAGVSKDFSLSQGPYTVIHDYDIGVQYAIARDMGTCSIDPIPVKAKGFDASYNITRQTLGMRSPMQFLNMGQPGYVYAGQRDCRGQQCDVFQNLVTDLPGHGPVVYEVYFLKGAQDVSDRGDEDQQPNAVPMRILVWEHASLVNQYEIHDFTEANPLMTIFDVTPCYQGQGSIDFEVFITMDDTSMMPQMAPVVKRLLTVQLAISAGITPLRLQRPRLHWDRYNVYFQGTLLGAAPASAKYELKPNKFMASGTGSKKTNVWSASDCADLCDNAEKSVCMKFDYCTAKVCTLGSDGSVSTLVSNNNCSHYRRVLGGGFDTQPKLPDVWTMLKNNVYRKAVTLTLPLPDASGRVDETVDTSKLDSTQKVTLTAYRITDQVVSNVNRNPASSSVMANFQVIPNKLGKGSQMAIPGLSVDDCASSCLEEMTFPCQSFHYCWEAGTCFISKQHPDERPNMLKDSSGCDLYYRDYTSNFQQFPGRSVLSSSNAVYQNVMSASQCAKLCTYYSDFHCESFDFCTRLGVCYLGQTHFYDVPKADIKQEPDCAHYSRDYVQDFVVKAHRQVKMRDNRVVQDVTPAQCAKLCVQETGFACHSFDYCGNYTECRLSDALVSNTGQVTLEPTAYCDVYARQYGTQGNAASAQSQKSDDSGYSSGAMGGMAISMVVVGLIIGVGIIAIYMKVTGRRPDDGMTVAFSKQADS
ncbi:uncharacterized protein LOC143294838 [Babylonia areolata]|uniref:uncharacterized protein LOC143294838 n=1 Tax=Babylonia areolata TaxID=304850 RepID=UPI003FCFDE73